MTNSVIQGLLTKAASLRQERDDILATAKEVLAGAQIPFQDESQFIKVACENSPNLVDLDNTANYLEKVAKYVGDLEGYCDSLEGQLASLREEHTKIELEKQANEDPVLQSLCHSGFTKDELSALQGVEKSVLQKVAQRVAPSATEDFSLGQESSFPNSVSSGRDKFLSFIFR